MFLNPFKGRLGSRGSLQPNRELYKHDFFPFFGDYFGFLGSGSTLLTESGSTLPGSETRYSLISPCSVDYHFVAIFFRDAGQAVVQNAFCEPGRPDHNQAKVNIRVYSWNWWSLRLESIGEIFWPFSPTGARTCVPYIRGSSRAVSEKEPAYPRQLIIQTVHILQLNSAVTDSLPRGCVVRSFQPYFPIT